MAKKIKLGTVAGLTLSTVPSAIIGFVFLWIVLSTIAILLLHLSAVEGIIGALLATILHWVGETVHQYGHAWAARRIGYPMIGIRYWGLLSTSVYPKDEPALPGALHIRRALGGPLWSAILSIITALITFALRSPGGLFWWLALFCFLDNFLIFTLGSLLPLGFTDGSTILYWRNKL